jgi:hypothetical protein
MKNNSAVNVALPMKNSEWPYAKRYLAVELCEIAALTAAGESTFGRLGHSGYCMYYLLKDWK